MLAKVESLSETKTISGGNSGVDKAQKKKKKKEKNNNQETSWILQNQRIVMGLRH
jgi:hypothetical protein